MKSINQKWLFGGQTSPWPPPQKKAAFPFPSFLWDFSTQKEWKEKKEEKSDRSPSWKRGNTKWVSGMFLTPSLLSRNLQRVTRILLQNKHDNGHRPRDTESSCKTESIIQEKKKTPLKPNSKLCIYEKGRNSPTPFTSFYQKCTHISTNEEW